MGIRSTLGRAVAPFLALFAAPAGLAAAADLPPGLYARILTTRGVILCRLEFTKTPLTVTNFVGLAEGRIAVDYAQSLARARQALPDMRARNSRELADAKRKNDARAVADSEATAAILAGFDERVANLPESGKPYYNGIVFHRVIDDFMVQVGDPLALGLGGPGYQFADEFDRTLRHDRAGILSMANAGPGTNGSQFFITHGPTPHLDGKHSVFGHVVEGQEVVNRLRIGDAITEVEIVRVGPEAEAFEATQESFRALQAATKLKAIADQLEAAQTTARAGSDEARAVALMLERLAGAQPDAHGIMHAILAEGRGEPVGDGKRASTHYTGYLLNGRKFDSSVDRGQPFPVNVGAGRVIRGWDLTLAGMRVGEKRMIWLPADLAYGVRGSPPTIPPGATLCFEMELLSVE